MQRLKFTVADALAVRFQLDPLSEVINSIATLRRPSRHPANRPWARQTAALLADDAFRPLFDLLGGEGYAPDFLTPRPAQPHPSVEQQLAAVRASPPALVRAELEAVADPSSGRSRRDRRVAAGLARDPVGSLRLLATQLEEYWRIALAPHWPRIHGVCARDAAAAARSIGERGVRAALADLHPSLRWDGDDLLLTRISYEATIALAGRGLVLVPNVFAWPRISTVTDQPWQPTLFYPARGAAAVWESSLDVEPAARSLLGGTRAAVLARLSSPATTAAVAAGVGISPATASHHLGVLTGAGLAGATRSGREVFYARTPLGDQVAGLGVHA